MKKLLYLLLLTPIIYLTSCSKSSSAPEVLYGCTDTSAINYDTLANTNDSSCIAIGYTYQGGIIFYLDGNGGGLIAAPSDQSPHEEWGCYGTSVAGADGTAIGTGAQNTIDILNGCSQAGTAADICANLTLEGYSDWFLPSKDELNQIHINLHSQELGGFANSHYWSSTETGFYNSWLQNFTNGYQDYTNKSHTYYVRAVRAF